MSALFTNTIAKVDKSLHLNELSAQYRVLELMHRWTYLPSSYDYIVKFTITSISLEMFPGIGLQLPGTETETLLASDQLSPRANYRHALFSVVIFHEI